MAPPRRDTWLLAALYVGLAFLLGRAHELNVDRPNMARKLALHADVLANRADDPYQYKLWPITWATEGIHRATGLRLDKVHAGNGYLAVLALLLAHHLWLARLFGRRSALLGTLLLAALAHALFLGYWHHPYDLWGVALFCLCLSAAASGAGLPALCALAAVTGLVWEKHALLAPIWALWRLREGDRLGPTALRGAALLACSVAVPVALRVALGTDRAPVDVTPVATQAWHAVWRQRAPFVLPFVAILAATWPRQPRFVRFLWLYVPGLFAIYLASEFFVRELRSFWAWVPVFTATACAWAKELRDDPAPAAPRSA